MATTAQIDANRENAQSSTGPVTADGKSRVSRNALTLGLFTMNDFVLPEESTEHHIFCAEFADELRPASPTQELYASEMIRAAWRLRRCGLVEAQLAAAAAEPQTAEQNEASLRKQTAVDRARLQANNIFRRAHNDLRRLQNEANLCPAAPVVAPATNGFGFSKSTTPADSSGPPVPQPAPANQTQSVPRGAPCPCLSGEKYKRCCGRSAPRLIHRAA